MANLKLNQFGLQRVLINGFPVDATVSESHDHAAEVSEYPRESGTVSSDHVRIKPLKITIEGIVSDCPLGDLATDPSRVGIAVMTQQAYSNLLLTFATTEPIDIVTSLQTYKSMVLDGLSIPRESGEPFQLHFKATFTQVTIVTNNRSTIRTATPAGQKRTALGERLAKLGLSDVNVVSTSHVANAAAFGSQLILTGPGPSGDGSASDQHYLFLPGIMPNADGHVDSTGYHSFYAYGSQYDPKTGFWTNGRGSVTNVMPFTGVEGQNQRTSAQQKLFLGTDTKSADTLIREGALF